MPLLKEVTTVLKAAQKLGAATPPAMQAVLETFVRMYGPPGVTRGVTSPAPEYRAIVSKAAESGQAPEREEIRLEMPAEASEAWRSARAHQQVLDQLFTTVIRPLHRLRVLPLETEPDWGAVSMGAWFIPPAKAHELGDVGLLFNERVDRYTIPGGRWLRIQGLTGLQLNSPSTAAAILLSLHEEVQRDHAARYASQTAGPDGVPMGRPRGWKVPKDQMDPNRRVHAPTRASVADTEEEPTTLPDEEIGFSEDTSTPLGR